MKLLSVASLILGLTIWQIASSYGWIDPLYFPGPASIVTRAWNLFNDDLQFRSDFFFSVKRLLMGVAIAFPLALLFALASSLQSSFRDILSPWIGLLYPVPKLALFPFLLVAMGTGDASKITMIAAGSFFLMFLSFQVGFKRIFLSEYFDIVRIYRVNKIKILWHVFLRGAAAEIFNGIKTGFGYGLVMMVGSEMTMSKNGLGFFMWNSWDQFRLLDMYSCLAWISFIGLISFRICDFVERKASEKESGVSSLYKPGIEKRIR